MSGGEASNNADPELLVFSFNSFIIRGGRAKNRTRGCLSAARRAIYPLGYILGTPGGLFGVQLVSDPKAAVASMDIVYNIADAINKIGFGLVIYALSRSED